MRMFRGTNNLRKWKKLRPRYMGLYVITEKDHDCNILVGLKQELADFLNVFSHFSIAQGG